MSAMGGACLSPGFACLMEAKLRLKQTKYPRNGLTVQGAVGTSMSQTYLRGNGQQTLRYPSRSPLAPPCPSASCNRRCPSPGGTRTSGLARAPARPVARSPCPSPWAEFQKTNWAVGGAARVEGRPLDPCSASPELYKRPEGLRPWL
jgi:hypothetical protein